MQKIVVIGNGMVGYKFCEKLIASGSGEKFEITVFGEEPRAAYDRVHLSAYFSVESASELSMAPLEWYKDNGITLHTSSLICEIDRGKKIVADHKNNIYPYDYLILATGSAPFVPDIEGIDTPGVFVYRTIEDLDAIKQYAVKARREYGGRAAILGGGLLGLEAANATKELGLATDVVEFAPRLMPRQLDDSASNMLQAKIESMGIGVYLNKSTSKIYGNNRIEALHFADGSQLKTDMLVISAGIRPRDELGRNAGLKTGERGGIWVDNKMQTSDASIYAIGEVAYYNGGIYGLVAPGYAMAEIAVNQICGGDKRMVERIDMSTQLKLIGTEVASFGDPFIDGNSASAIVFENKFSGIYKRINIDKESRTLLGGILIGDSSDYNTLFQLYINTMKLPETPEDLIIPNKSGETSAGSVMDLPDTAQICSCESISKGAICEAVNSGGCQSVKDVINRTKATTGCGGCKPMVTDLVGESLKALGKEVKETICEHFNYSRQELYDLVKINKVKDYNEALDLFGSGHGCEICKPVLASVFASIYMETANRQVTIQDSNDKFLANIQRNGTYSVVPRVAGGEITPEKLVVLGRVARKYDLYSKITGGQRIDLFGAKLDQLPDIWRELIEAGFESGHAYGKSLRTVKSCVGSTWCRYGMHESVSFAIRIEERYKGLRSPHKLKGGVSGCIRECAEARGKDFGIIAVEKGWNLYVCGNGGATPKHAVLLAEQLDDETCIKYLDRFLMYYIRTAPPLTRTAPWLEKLEGGIEYLKQVVIEDSLGIAEDLENEMQNLVDSYVCEWKQAIEDPEMMKRFRHFVNSDETDSSIEFVPMREQKMPKPWR